MQLTDFQWQERTGRFPDDTAFDQWIFQHASGRIVAVIDGPVDKRGGFTHNVSFLFHQDVMMDGGPFVFADFDSGKLFVESVLATKPIKASAEGSLEIIQPPPNPQVTAMNDAIKSIQQLGMSALFKARLDQP